MPCKALVLLQEHELVLVDGNRGNASEANADFAMPGGTGAAGPDKKAEHAGTVAESAARRRQRRGMMTMPTVNGRVDEEREGRREGRRQGRGETGWGRGRMARPAIPSMWVDLAGLIVALAVGAMPSRGSCDPGAKNDLGFVRTGPLHPMLYPSKVSVIVPCYNCGDFIINAFESFERGFELLHDFTLSKGMPPVSCEVIVVDDKSTDSSVEAVRSFMESAEPPGAKACIECTHPPPQYVLLQHETNMGAGATRNHGVEAAKGDIIFFGEADDVFYEHHIPGECTSPYVVGEEPPRYSISNRNHAVIRGSLQALLES